jgi:ribose-phosphate pyrophosphokinase
MKLTVLTGRANSVLAEAVVSSLGIELTQCTIENFPDGEIHVEIDESLQGHDVYLIQPTSPPAENHLVELLLLSDACKRAGAARLTALVPYFGYARQDRRAHAGESIAARLVADLLCTRLERIVTMDLHNPAIEGFFTVPAENLSAVPLLAEALRPSMSSNNILVAPDLGAVKLAQRYADLLKLPVAYVHKIRLSSKQVSVRNIVGDVCGRSPVVVDDMISTGGTMVSAIKALLDKGCLPQITVVASHGLLVGNAAQRLASLPVQNIFVTNSVGQPFEMSLPVQVVNLKHMLADAIKRLHEDNS